MVSFSWAYFGYISTRTNVICLLLFVYYIFSTSQNKYKDFNRYITFDFILYLRNPILFVPFVSKSQNLKAQLVMSLILHHIAFLLLRKLGYDLKLSRNIFLLAFYPQTLAMKVSIQLQDPNPEPLWHRTITFLHWFEKILFRILEHLG